MRLKIRDTNPLGKAKLRCAQKNDRQQSTAAVVVVFCPHSRVTRAGGGNPVMKLLIRVLYLAPCATIRGSLGVATYDMGVSYI